MSSCPQCGDAGQRVGAVTVDAQVRLEVLCGLADRTGWRMCRGATCATVYFRDGESVGIEDVKAVPFQKSGSPRRLVCFCFEHSVEAVERDVDNNGVSAIEASIRAACSQGLDDCKRRNPQGRCCLGNVRAVLKGTSAPGFAGESGCGAGDDCCGSAVEEPVPASTESLKPEATNRGALAASGGALLASLLSSACCWLPLLALAVGASTAGVGAFFEAWRVPLLLVTVASLGGGFYLAYRTPRCEPGEACAVPNPRLKRINRLMLWASTVLVVVFALFPEYLGAITGGGGSVATAVDASQHHSQYTLQGMTCVGCEAHAREAIAAIPGVVDVAVSYETGSAEVVWDGVPDDAAVGVAVGEFGYRASPR
jgi:copper chaperone CopZ